MNFFRYYFDKALNRKIIAIDKPIFKNNGFFYNISTTHDLDKYFLKKDSFIDHINVKDDLSSVPEGISIIPILSNVLPVSWIMDATIVIDELDKTFFESIKTIKENFSLMFPKIEFKGRLIVKKIVDYDRIFMEDKYMSFFSGGVDSTFTVINNIDKKPVLTSIWGSDMPIDETEGWKNLSDIINQFSKEFDLEKVFIKSDFKELLNIKKLNGEIIAINDNWWHGLQHGISIISHGVIYAYKNQIGNILIASSHSTRDLEERGVEVIPCGSSPIIDNYFKFSNCKVIHDGFDFTRQEKIGKILDYVNENDKNVYIKVCWESISGKNCSKCVKCCKSMLGVLAEKQDPNLFGFEFDESILDEIYEKVTNSEDYGVYWNINKGNYWKHIFERFQEDPEYWKEKKNLKWIFDLKL
nr:hypothetical protein [Methanobrevibacter arboriphilus]